MTSNQTNKDILTILDKYLPRDQLTNLFVELSEVKGNTSFQKSMKNIYTLIATDTTIGMLKPYAEAIKKKVQNQEYVPKEELRILDSYNKLMTRKKPSKNWNINVLKNK